VLQSGMADSPCAFGDIGNHMCVLQFVLQFVLQCVLHCVFATCVEECVAVECVTLWDCYGVATASRFPKNVGLFCRTQFFYRALLQKRPMFVGSLLIS